MRTRLALRGHCPLSEMWFAIVNADGKYLTTKEVPIQWDADIGMALLWERRREAEGLLASMLGLHRCRVVQVREEA